MNIVWATSESVPYAKTGGAGGCVVCSAEGIGAAGALNPCHHAVLSATDGETEPEIRFRA